jgi:deoxyribodipyrimidine photo-lyase
MITGSFLVKHLLIDWRWGEKYFRHTLIDGDTSQNVGNWQGVAGTGFDAAPYFRIFNPIRQSEKFDKEGSYIRKWIPELSSLSTKQIHSPWEVNDEKLNEVGVQLGINYPYPIVDHSFARERCLEAYKTARAK